MSATFELHTEDGSLTVGRYAGRLEDKAGSRRRYNITNCYGKPAQDLTRADLVKLAEWILVELAQPHKDE
jgi:hypothetical protein